MIEDRNIRIFLSSTFADMQEERNYLVKKTLPALYTECKKRNVDLSVVDLRWGITEEESKTGKVIEICLDEIERTRPFFIGIVGGRYGWIPSESEFKINEHLLLKYPWIKEKIDKGASITELEMQYGALENSEKIKSFFFLREINSVPKKFREEEGSRGFSNLNKLRKQIKSAAIEGKCHVTPYKSISSLGDAIYSQLMSLVDELYPEREENQWESIENKQRATMARLAKTFCHRDDILYENSNVEFIQGINTESDICTFLFGESGYGKSSVLSCEIGKDIKGIPVFHAIIDENLNTVDKLCRFLLYQLSRKIDGFNCPEINEIDKIINLQNIFVRNKQINCHFFWILDGIERLSYSEDKSMTWLANMPDNISFIISTTDKSLINKAKSVWNKEIKQCNIPALSASCIMEITSTYLRNLSKVLTTKQRSHICTHPVLSNPRMLQLFLSEISTFGIYEKLNEYIDQFINSEDTNGFLSVFLKRLEQDFGEEKISDLLLLLCMSNIGLTGQQLNEYLKLTPIEFCAIINAIEPITRCLNQHFYIENEIVKNFILEYFGIENDEKKQKEKKIRLFIIKCLKNEIKKIPIQKDTSLYQKILGKMMNTYWGVSSNPTQYLSLITELSNQYIKMGKIDKVYKMSRNMGGVSNAHIILAIRNYKNGIPGLFSIWFLLYLYVIKSLDPILTTINQLATKEQKIIFLKRTNRLFFLKKFKKHVKEVLNEEYREDLIFENTWNIDKVGEIDFIKLLNFSQQIINSGDFNLPRIRRIVRKGELFITHNELKYQYEELYVGFCHICCCCHLRLGNFSEATRYFSLQEDLSGGSFGKSSNLTLFMLAVKGNDFAKCHQIIKEYELNDDYISLSNKARLVIMLMDAEGEKEETIFDYIHKTAKMIKNDEEQRSCFMSIGTWLYIWGIKKYAKESFCIALKASKSVDERIICYVNLANCYNDSPESISFLRKRIELAKSKFGDKWNDELLDYYIDYLYKLRKNSPQNVCDDIDNIIMTYNDLSDKAKSSLYHLKGGCYVDIYDKTKEDRIYQMAMDSLNNSLVYVPNKDDNDDYLSIIASRLNLLIRKGDSDITQQNDLQTIENFIFNNSNVNNDLHLINSLMWIYIETRQMAKARQLYERFSQDDFFSAKQIQIIKDSYINQDELIRIATEKISKFQSLFFEGKTYELITWMTEEKKNGYNFDIIKSILQNKINNREEVSISRIILLYIDIQEGGKPTIPDDFYLQYLYEPDMVLLVSCEANICWSLQHPQPMPSEVNEEVIQELGEKQLKGVIEIASKRLLSLCDNNQISNEDYIRVFNNYSSILGNQLSRFLDIIVNDKKAENELCTFLKSPQIKSYDICRQMNNEIFRIKKIMERDQEGVLKNYISKLVDNCAYDMFKDGDKADYSINMLVGIVDGFHLQELGNYTLYMIIQAKYNAGDWTSIISLYPQYCSQATNDTVSFFISIYAVQSYANLGDNENANKLFSQLLNTSGENNVFITEIYGRYLLQYGKYKDCNNYIVKYLDEHQDGISTEVLVEFWKLLSTVKIYIGDYEQSLKLLDMYQQHYNKEGGIDDNLREGRILRLVIFYVRQGLYNDALRLYKETSDFEHMGFSDLKIRAYIELSRMYTKLNKYDNALNMKEKAMDCMS